MISANFARSGGAPAAALITSAHSRKYCGSRAAGVNHAERLHFLGAVVIKPVDGASRNAECLARPDVNLFSVDSPGEHALDAIDGLLVMVVAMRWSRQALRARDDELKGRDAASRVVSGEQEAHRERPETDGLVGRIDAEVDGLLCHVNVLSYSKPRLPCCNVKATAGCAVNRPEGTFTHQPRIIAQSFSLKGAFMNGDTMAGLSAPHFHPILTDTGNGPGLTTRLTELGRLPNGDY
jgi:hypothetical protein